MDDKLDKIDSEVATFIKNQRVARISDSPPLWNTQDTKEQQDFQEFQNNSFQTRLNSLKKSIRHLSTQTVADRKRGLNFKEENKVPTPPSSLFAKLKGLQQAEKYQESFLGGGEEVPRGMREYSGQEMTGIPHFETLE